MKKLLVLLLVAGGLATTASTFALNGGQFTGVNVGQQWFFDQEKLTQPLSASQCLGANVARDYYLAGDFNNDGRKDAGAAKYYRDNFRVVGGTISQYLVLPRFSTYNGTKVAYYSPEQNVLSILNGTNTVNIDTTNAWYRWSKLAPKDQWVRAVESEPILVSAPLNPANRNIQIAYQIHYASYNGIGAGAANYQVFPVANGADGAVAMNSWFLNAGYPNNPVFPTNFTNTRTPITTTAINWNTSESIHDYECLNITLRRCGDGVEDTADGEQCDNGAGNGQPGNLCTALCQDAPVVQDPDVSIVKSVVGSLTGYASGDIITFKLLYRNHGTGMANNVTIRDELPAGVTYVGSTSNPNIGNPAISSNILTWNVPTLAPGAVGDITIQVKLTNYAACFPYTNKSIIAALNEPAIFSGDNTSQATVTTSCPDPDVLTQKSVSTISGTYLPGSQVEYTLTYTNIGAATANGVVVTDTLPSQVTYVAGSSTSTPNIGQPAVAGQVLTWNVGTLAPGQSGQIKIRAIIKATAPTCTNLQVNNTFTISATNEPSVFWGNNPSNAQFIMQCVDLWSNKTVDKPIVADGDIVTYTIRYGNAGNVAWPGTVTDTLPAGMQYVAGSASSTPNVGQPSVAGQVLTWNVGTLIPGAQGTITIQARVVAPMNPSYVNNVCITDDNNVNNNNCGTAISTTQTGTVDFRSRKVVDKPLVVSGDIVTYTITYGNSGNTAWPGNIADTLPVDVAFIPGSSTSTPNLGQPSVTVAPGGFQILMWTGGTIPAGSTRTISFQARITHTFPGQQFLNLVCIADDGNNDNNNCGTATSTTTGGGTSGSNFDLSINKTPKLVYAIPGDQFDYTLTVSNSGVAVNGFTVKDYLPAGLDFVSSPQTFTYDAATKTVTWNNLNIAANGTLALTVKVKYVGPGTQVNYTEICDYRGSSSIIPPMDVDSNPCNGTGNNEDDVSSGKVVSAFIDLNLNKLANGVKTLDAFSGDIIDFSLVVGNSGNVAATDFSVNDYLPTGFVFVQASVGGNYNAANRQITWTGLSLAPGATTTLTFKATYLDSVERINYAEVCTYNGRTVNQSGNPTSASNPQDIDSDPCNRGANPEVEDDESSASVRPRTASNIFDLSIDKLIDGVKVKNGAVSGQQYTVTLNVTNSGGVGVSNFTVKDYMPVGLDFVAGTSVPAGATYDATGRIVSFTGLNIGANQTVSLTFKAVYRDVINRVNYTEICDYRGTNASGNTAKDIDSNPCNRGPNVPIEDDESSAQIGPGGGGGGGPTVDVTLNKLVNGVKDYQATNGEVVTYTLRATNEGNTTITKVSIVDYLPTNVEYVTGSALPNTLPVTVSYDPATRKLTWSGLTLTNNSVLDLSFKATYRDTVARTNYAEVCAYNGKTVKNGQASEPSDTDSDPCNRGANPEVEDDESSAVVRPKGVCTSNCGGGGGRNFCGDGLIARPNSNGQWEDCDDGLNGSATCSKTCKKIGNVDCGNGLIEFGEVCDQGNNGGIIPKGRPYAGRTCTNVCTIKGVATPACDYIDPPSIQSNEYLPYRWDLENIGRVTTSCENPGDIVRDSMECEFTVRDASAAVIESYTKKCADSTPDNLTRSAYRQVMIGLGYDPDDSRIKPYGYDSRRFAFNNKKLGEHKIEVSIKSYSICNADGKGGYTQQVMSGIPRVCEMNFAVTKPYMVSRGPLGNFTSDPDKLTEFFAMPGNTPIFSSPIPLITQKFDTTAEVNASVQKLVDQYKKLAVSDDTYTSSQKAFGTVAKVPGKDIYFFEAPTDDGTITVNDSNGDVLGDKPFTIIVTKGHLVVGGNMAKAKRGMYIVTNGELRFKVDSCNYTQDVHGIFIGLKGVKPIGPEGYDTAIINNDQSKNRCMAGDLTIRGVLIGNGVENMTNKRRSNVNTWFTENTDITSDRKEYLLNHGSVVLKYNPDLFDNLPPGAEILAQVLNTYKK